MIDHEHALVTHVSGGDEGPLVPAIVRQWCVDCDYERSSLRWYEND